MRHLSLLPMLLLAACAAPAGPDSAAVPVPAGVVSAGAGDPLRAAVSIATTAFPAPGNPADAARAVAIGEYLAAEIPRDQRMTSKSGLLPLEWRAARQEWRAALGIGDRVPAAVASVALAKAGDALRKGDTAATARALGPLQSPRLPQALTGLSLPRAQTAAMATSEELLQQGDPGGD
jgi:hypothetical protein